MLVSPPQERPRLSRLGLLAGFLSFDPAPCAQLEGGEDLRGDVGGRKVAGTGGVLMGAYHPGIDPDRPLRALVLVGVAAQLVQDPHPGAIA